MKAFLCGMLMFACVAVCSFACVAVCSAVVACLAPDTTHANMEQASNGEWFKSYTIYYGCDSKSNSDNHPVYETDTGKLFIRDEKGKAVILANQDYCGTIIHPAKIETSIKKTY